MTYRLANLLKWKKRKVYLADVGDWLDLLDDFGPALLRFVVDERLVATIPESDSVLSTFRESMRSAQLSTLKPSRGAVWILFAFKDDLAVLPEPFRKDGLLLPFAWVQAERTGPCVPAALASLASKVRDQFGAEAEGWQLAPADYFGDDVDFEIPGATFDSAWGALASGLYLALHPEVKFVSWPFSSVAFDFERGEPAPVGGLEAKFRVAASFGAEEIAVAPVQQAEASKRLNLLKACCPNDFQLNRLRIFPWIWSESLKDSLWSLVRCNHRNRGLRIRPTVWAKTILGLVLAVGVGFFLWDWHRERCELQVVFRELKKIAKDTAEKPPTGANVGRMPCNSAEVTRKDADTKPKAGTHPVGRKRPNDWGIYDMIGNVCELCADFYADDYYAKSPPEDPTGPLSGSFRVCRGGAWSCSENVCRSGKRSWRGSSYRDRTVGFRLVCSGDGHRDEKAGARMILGLQGGATMEMVYCPPGSFLMGTSVEDFPFEAKPPFDKAFFRDIEYRVERQHKVVLTSGFWIGKYEVTQRQWESVMGSNPSDFRDFERPVENVSWMDCQEFISKVNATGKARVALPTEAQWEYACRAGSARPIPNGRMPCVPGADAGPTLYDIAWYADNASVDMDLPASVGVSCLNEVKSSIMKRKPAAKVLRPLRSPASLPAGEDMQAEGLRTGDTKTIVLPGGAKMKMVYCPPSPEGFWMGCNRCASQHRSNERLHLVKLTKGFWIGQFEVTQGEWKSVLGSNPSSNKMGDDWPVENVSWEDCKKFVAKINEDGKHCVSLPTEAQWEYACRAGTRTPFSFGETLNGTTANCDGNYPYGTVDKGKCVGHTTCKGSYKPNAWNIFDMHGNVAEWCEDRYDADFYSKKEARTDPCCTKGSGCVNRGGGWLNYAWCCRSASRFTNEAGESNNNLGFRLVCSDF